MEMIRFKQLQEMVPLSRMQIWRLEKMRQFPRHIQLTKNCIAWNKAEVLAWLEARKEASNA